jgi:hypothetical protein
LESENTTRNGFWSATATLPISKLTFNICPHPVLFAGDLECARLATSHFGKCIFFQLSQRAAVELYKISVECGGRRMIFSFNDQVLGLSLPIENAISNDTLTIFPEVEEEALDSLIVEINDCIAKLKKMKKD